MDSFEPIPVPASYRDPRGQVYECEGRIYRAIHVPGVADYQHTLASGFYLHAEGHGWLIKSSDATAVANVAAFPNAVVLLEHERVPFISYPYEWTFAQLKDAALLHLDLHLAALTFQTTMLDSSAFNIQFRGAKPIFIDYLSFIPYLPGSLWVGHHQFCEQFLNPLLLHAKAGIEFQPWYRGTGIGISTQDTFHALPFGKWLSVACLLHVVGKHFLDKKAARHSMSTTSGTSDAVTSRKTSLSKNALARMLQGLRNAIAGLQSSRDRTLWENYEHGNSYNDADRDAKHQFVQKICSQWGAMRVVDLGGNTGEFSETALAAGAREIILIDADHGALSLAYRRAVGKSLNILPLLSNIMNLSPAQGWRNLERPSLWERLQYWKPDTLLALALIHHLAIGGNVPLSQVVDQVFSVAPRGIIEFVPKNDPMVQIMLRFRQDIFVEYSIENFQKMLAARKQIVDLKTLQSGRTLFAYV